MPLPSRSQTDALVGADKNVCPRKQEYKEEEMIEGLFRRRRLPHWDVEDGTYFVTTCLEGSLSAQGLLDLRRYREELDKRARPKDVPAAECELRLHKLLFARFDEEIDLRPAVRHLENAALATEVQQALYHFAGDHYDLLAYVVMPSHLHWVFHPREDWVRLLAAQETERNTGQTGMSTSCGADIPVCRPTLRTPRELIMKSLKGYTARRCNQLLKKRGIFWQDESYDHVVRNDEELRRIIEYIEQNPVKAELVAEAAAWRWSSAADRPSRSVAAGEYVLR